MPLAGRSTANVVLMFLVLSPLVGVAILGWVVVNAIAHAWDFTAADWFWQVGWAGWLGAGLTVGLPAVGWQELKRRRPVPPSGTAPDDPATPSP